MTAALSRGSLLLRRLLNFARNPITVLGLVLTTVSGILIVTFVVIELAGGILNVYASTIVYLVLPAFFVVGLLVMPIGVIIRRRRLLRSGANVPALGLFPVLDFNDPSLRRLATLVLALTVVNAVIFGSVSFLAVERMETVEFCGEVCHTVMLPEYTAYQSSPHSRVACVDCHIGPGAPWFVRSKLDGLRQVWHTALDTYNRPIASPIRHLRPARETCEQCHWPTKHHGDMLRVISRSASDKANTPSYTALLIKTGGGRMDAGRHGGIHWWHIEGDNLIRYVPGDERREEIQWVELTLASGEVRTYARPEQTLPAPQELDRAARVMDCIDCHNRPTHLFESPAKALDRELEEHPQLRQLPFFKRIALEAIESGYPSHDEGIAAVRARVVAAYRSGEGEPAPVPAHLIAVGADVAAHVYGRSTFPEMDTTWETHPNHIGHDEFPGCWRCHDDEMASTDGRVIPQDCETCHIILAEDLDELPSAAHFPNG